MELPRGTVTMVFTDVEGSTRLLHELGTEAYVRALEDHRRLLREAVTAHGGVEVEMQGDSFHFAFADAYAAVQAAAAAQRALAEHRWEAKAMRVRMGVHTGHPLIDGRLYAGADVHRAARVMGAGHGGQVLISETTRPLLGEEFTLRDLGEHRLKDLLAPLRLYQFGDEEFPAPRSLLHTNLPLPPTLFLGRVRELAELAALLADSNIRLLTLTGPGGTGKTRLAVQAAAETADLYPDGVQWVGLATVDDPTLVLPTIAQALGAEGELAAHVGAKRILLVLDNFEQLVDAALELAELLSACPSLTLLVTSRERLHLSGEHEYAVPPLHEADAAALFEERARAVRSDVRGNGEVVEICRRLDRLPLAIELAAARVKVLSPSALLHRLEQRLPLLTGGARDAPARQRTLEATIDWSHDLLMDAERRLFARLSVFSGGCTLEAAEAVAGADLDALHSLVDKSLLRHSGERYWMLETIREYAAHRLAETGETDAVRRLHAEAILALSAEAEEGLETGDYGCWVSLLEQEHGNLRAALSFFEESGETGAQLELIGRTRVYWHWGRWLEGRRWAEAALAAGESEFSIGRGKTLLAASGFALALGDDHALDYGYEALAVFRKLGEAKFVARSLGALGVCLVEREQYEEAERMLEEAMAAARQADDGRVVAMTICNLGDLAMRRGLFERAATITREALAMFRQMGEEDLTGWALCNLAECLLRTGREEEAVAAARESLMLSHSVSDVQNLVWGLNLVAALASGGDAGAEARAAAIVGAADALREHSGLYLSGTAAELLDETVDKLRHALGPRYEAAYTAGRRLSPDEAVERALGMLGGARRG